MKNLIRISTILMLLLVGVGFTSCGDDDNDGPSENYEFIGTWTRTYTVDDVTTEEITFNKNNKGSMIIFLNGKPSYTYSFDWKATGNKISINLPDWDKLGTLTYSVSGNTLTLIDEEEKGKIVYTRKK